MCKTVCSLKNRILKAVTQLKKFTQNKAKSYRKRRLCGSQTVYLGGIAAGQCAICMRDKMTPTSALYKN